MKEDIMKGLYFGREGDNKYNNEYIVVSVRSVAFFTAYVDYNDDNDDSKKTDYMTYGT